MSLVPHAVGFLSGSYTQAPGAVSPQECLCPEGKEGDFPPTVTLDGVCFWGYWAVSRCKESAEESGRARPSRALDLPLSVVSSGVDLLASRPLD
jgi:hypothetical protein